MAARNQLRWAALMKALDVLPNDIDGAFALADRIVEYAERADPPPANPPQAKGA